MGIFFLARKIPLLWADLIITYYDYDAINFLCYQQRIENWGQIKRQSEFITLNYKLADYYLLIFKTIYKPKYFISTSFQLHVSI